MREVLIYMVTAGDTILLRTLNKEEAERAATSYFKDTGTIPELWEDSRIPTDHTRKGTCREALL